MAEKIEAHLILEILGRPAEHIKDALNELLTKLGSEKGIKIISKDVHEPKPIKDSDLFTSFADVSVELDSMQQYFGIMFAYMPAHIEIVYPENFNLANFQFNELGNRLLSRLHEYDAITKKVIFERNILVEKLKQTAPHLFLSAQEQAPPAKSETKTKKAKPEKKSKKN
jgi:hypothetical protein